MAGEGWGANGEEIIVYHDRDNVERRVIPTAMQPGLRRGGDIEPSCTASQRLLKIDRLSRRELEALAFAASGETDRQIAEHMVVTHRTVRSFFTSAFRKLGARNRVELALTGLLTHVARCDTCMQALVEHRKKVRYGTHT